MFCCREFILQWIHHIEFHFCSTRLYVVVLGTLALSRSKWKNPTACIICRNEMLRAACAPEDWSLVVGDSITCILMYVFTCLAVLLHDVLLEFIVLLSISCLLVTWFDSSNDFWSPSLSISWPQKLVPLTTDQNTIGHWVYFQTGILLQSKRYYIVHGILLNWLE